MERPQLLYAIYTGFLALLLAAIVATPYLALSTGEEPGWLYEAFSITCHQKLSRSLCLFNEGGFFVADCTPQNGTPVRGDNRIVLATVDGAAGYKFPVCARDLGLYLAMLLGALAYPAFRRLDDRAMLPPAFLVLSIVPFGLDGTLQLASGIFPDILGVYESTNLTRFATGFLAGFVASWFVIPIINSMFGEQGKPPQAAGKKGAKQG